MPWTDGQWEAFCSLLREGWPGEFDEAAAQAWRLLLSDVAPDQAVAGLRSLVARGQRFRPSVGELATAASPDLARPTFSEALRAVYRCVQVRPAAAALDRAERDHHPLVAGFMRSVGVERLRVLPLNDPTYGELRRAELHEEWNAFTQRADERKARGLELSPARRGELVRFDPLAALGPGPGQDGRE